jgi:hypothetical protein
MNLMTSESVSDCIEKFVATHATTYLDALVHFAEEQDVDPESLAKLLTPSLKNKIRQEAEQRRLLKSLSRLPLD